MKYKDAFKKAQECDHALAAVLKETSHRKPPSDAESVIICKPKVRQGIVPFECDGNCPEGV